MSQMRLDLLEKKLEVMQSELSQVLGEMQKTIHALAAMASAGMQGLDARIAALEPAQPRTDFDTPESGKEL